MSAALIDLVSVGAQDVYITGDPQVSFFRQNYKRHTNFAIKPERLDYIGSFTAGAEIKIPIQSKGDLLSYVWLEGTNINTHHEVAHTTSLFNSRSNPTEFSLWIGGQEVCKLDALYIAGVHNVLYNESQAKATTATNTRGVELNSSPGSYVIPFFFSEDWTKSLPLVALQYHEVEIRIKCRTGGSSDLGAIAPKAYASYIYLDTAEREFFANSEHELLITQVQYQPMNKDDTSVDLSYFNHPVKAVHVAASTQTNIWSFTEGTMYINGTPLFENMTSEYHTNVVPGRHCSVLPHALDTEPVATWPFCLTMNKSQPTGSLNFSRIDSAKLALKGTANANSGVVGAVRAYGVNYNILRIKNGMGGVAFGN